MTGPYDVNIRLTCENLVSREIFLVMTQAGRLHDVWNKMSASMKTMSLGGLAIGGGIATFKVLESITDKAKELSHELVQIQKLGINPAQFEAAKAAAYAIPGEVPGMTSVGALKIYGQTFSQLGHENALKMMKPLATFIQSLGSTAGGEDSDYKAAQDKVYNMVRAGDLMGKFINQTTHQVDTDKLEHFLDIGSRVVQASHGKVSADTWFSMAQQGGPAMSNMSDPGLYTMAILSQMMGGPRAGTALMSGFQQLVGGTMAQWRAQMLQDMGFVGGYSVGKGGHLSWDKGALDTPFTQAVQRDPLEAVKMLQEGLAKQGFDTIEKQVPELFKLFQRQTTIREWHDLLRDYPQFLGERPRMAAGLGTSAAASLQNSEDYKQVMFNFNAAWSDMTAHIGLPMAKAAIPIITQITGAFIAMSKWAEAYPDIPGYLWKIGMGLSALLVAGGTVAIFTGAIAALGGLPYVTIAAAIGTVGYAIYELYQLSKSMTPKDIENSIKSNNAILDFYSKKLFGMTGGQIAAALGDPEKWRHAAGAVIAGIPVFFDTIRNEFTSHLRSLGNRINAEIDDTLAGLKSYLPSWLGGGTGSTLQEGPWHKVSPTAPEKHSALTTPPNRQVSINIPVTAYLDGRKLAGVVMNQAVASATYPRDVGGMDTRSTWAGPSYQPYEQG